MQEDLPSGFAARKGSNQSAQLQRQETKLEANKDAILSNKRITRVLNRQRWCADLSVALLFACTEVRFFRKEAQIVFIVSIMILNINRQCKMNDAQNNDRRFDLMSSKQT